MVAIGRVLGAYGLRGEIRVEVLGEHPEHLCRARRVWLSGTPMPPPARSRKRASEGTREETGGETGNEAREGTSRAGLGPPGRVCAARAGRPGEVRLQLEGVGDREEAQALEGLWLLGEETALDPLPEGEWYWYQVVGCRVRAQDGTPIGVVRELWETGAHDVLVVEGEDGRTRLLPAAETFLKEVDIRERRIVIEVIPGLLDPV